MAGENKRGFHNTASQGHDHNIGRSSGGGPPHGGPHKHMAEPTNHGGHTYDKAKTAEHDRRTEATRVAHGQHGHAAGMSKHGAEHHLREQREEPGERREEPE